jgi:hypothetical protein
MSHHHPGETAASVTTLAWLHDTPEEIPVSYDVSFEVPLPDGGTAEFGTHNYTSNCARMWREAGCDIAAFDGQSVTEFAPALAQAINTMEADMNRFRRMNPRNGWGNADDCLRDFLRPLLVAAQTVRATAVVRVSC